MAEERLHPAAVENSKELSSPTAADPLENADVSCRKDGEVVTPAASVVTPIAQE
ncbi:hypothetical protein Hanom_Chr04g00286501 [Helianthus anomalus]